MTPAGRDEVAAWFTTSVARTRPPRDELAIKLALAVTVPGVDVGTVIQQQRSATMAALQDYPRLKRSGPSSGEPSDLSWSLVLTFAGCDERDGPAIRQGLPPTKRQA